MEAEPGTVICGSQDAVLTWGLDVGTVVSGACAFCARLPHETDGLADPRRSEMYLKRALVALLATLNKAGLATRLHGEEI